ncbi:hypothetical protein Fmac_017854 [Flemingia macrophylla]|uniref:Uncharacterized protein n=1 Tax=Flemingia macrophylla TaxID=520843 RepID=A0ABD1M401_9FABA
MAMMLMLDLGYFSSIFLILLSMVDVLLSKRVFIHVLFVVLRLCSILLFCDLPLLYNHTRVLYVFASVGHEADALSTTRLRSLNCCGEGAFVVDEVKNKGGDNNSSSFILCVSKQERKKKCGAKEEEKLNEEDIRAMSFVTLDEYKEEVEE